MSLIINYPTLETVTGNELLPVFSTTNSDTRKISISALASYVITQVNTNMSGFATQYAAPSAETFNVYISDAQRDIHCILTPISSFVDGGITLPIPPNTLDGQRVLFNTTQAVTNFTVNGNGASVVGAPTTLAQFAFFTIKYDKLTSTWYKVG